MGHLGQPVGDGLHAVGLPGDSPVQRPSQFLASCLHCSDNRCRRASARELTFRALPISFDVLLCILCCFIAGAGFFGLLGGILEALREMLHVVAQQPDWSSGVSQQNAWTLTSKHFILSCSLKPAKNQAKTCYIVDCFYLRQHCGGFRWSCG